MRFKDGSILKIWCDLKESNTPSDFPNLMADVQHKLLVDAYRSFPSEILKVCKLTTSTDFKTQNRKWLSGFDDLLEITNTGEGGYQAGTMKDYGYSVALKTFGRTFSLARQTVIDDDLDAFKVVPTRMGQAAMRTQAKAIANILETNPAAYDGTALFRAANMSSTALTADATGIAAIQAAIKAIKTATDPHTSEVMGLRAKYLLVSPALEAAAKWLMSATEVRGGSSSTLTSNPVKGLLEVVVEPYLTLFPNRWYVFADPNDLPALEVTHLEGEVEPALLMEQPAIKLDGGNDDYDYPYDDINYKVRHDRGLAVGFFQAAYKGGA